MNSMANCVPVLLQSYGAICKSSLQFVDAFFQCCPLPSAVVSVLTTSDLTNGFGNSPFLSLQTTQKDPQRGMANTNYLIPPTMEAERN